MAVSCQALLSYMGKRTDCRRRLSARKSATLRIRHCGGQCNLIACTCGREDRSRKRASIMLLLLRQVVQLFDGRDGVVHQRHQRQHHGNG